MRTLYSGLMAFVVLLIFTSVTNDHGSFDARINTFKQECKQAIKPARYEGSRITYYGTSEEAQKKSLETFLLLNTEYKFAFSGKECSSKVGVKFYDSADESKRHLLKEVKNINGKNQVISSNDLNQAYRKFNPSSDRMKTLYIEYTIAPSKVKNEAVVLVIGYMD